MTDNDMNAIQNFLAQYQHQQSSRKCSRCPKQSSRKCRRCSKQSRTAESTKPITAAAVTAVTTSIDDGAMESVRQNAATQLHSLEKWIKWQRSALDQGIEKMIEIAHRQDRQEREKVCKPNLFLCIWNKWLRFALEFTVVRHNTDNKSQQYLENAKAQY